MDVIFLQERLALKKWQKENETWRTDFTDIDNDISALEKEIKQIKEKEQEDIKWHKYIANPKKLKKEDWNDDDYDNWREAEEATQIALENLGQYDNE